VGDVGRLIKAQDLRQFDIITLNRGNGLLYLFGQFAILANRPEVLEAWKVFHHHACTLTPHARTHALRHSLMWWLGSVRFGSGCPMWSISCF
jgi:hypothetical protein